MITFKIKRRSDEGKVYKGREALQLPKGSILKVLSNPNDNDAIGSIIIRTGNDIKPFKNVMKVNGTIYNTFWGPSIENYSFIHLADKTIQDYLEI
jgi:hypothetical protein